MMNFDHTRCAKQPPSVLLADLTPSVAPAQSWPVAALNAWMHAWRRRRAFKRLAASLLAYDDYQLDDIGFTRQELLVAIDLPLKVDAGRVLASWHARRLEKGAARTQPASSRRRPPKDASAQNMLRLKPGDITGWRSPSSGPA